MPAPSNDARSALLKSSDALRPVPRAVSYAYSAALPSLVQSVNRRIQSAPRYHAWLGDRSPQLLADNHRHAGQFMEEVFVSGNYDLLAASLPWVYHSYHSQGVPFDYFQSELSAWKSAVCDALPGEQASALLPVYDWMLRQHDTVINLVDERRKSQCDGVAPGLETLFAALKEAAFGFDDQRVLELCRGARDGGMPLQQLLHGLIYPLMQHIGSRWERGELSVADEHEITAIINRVLASLYFDQRLPSERRGLALVAASINEHHEMGAWMVAICLELDGWDVEYLGANVPGQALIEKALEVQPDLLALSLSMPFNLGSGREVIRALRAQMPDLKIIIGGQVFQLLPRLADGMGADACLQDAMAAVDWARAHLPVGSHPFH